MKHATAIVVLWAMVCPGISMAQETTGAIIGTITSEDGQPLPGATLKLCDDDKGFERTAVSGSEGRYKLVALQPARYELTTIIPGFQTVRRSIRIELGRTVTNDIQMSLGAVTETIEVTGKVPQVDVTSNVGGMTVNTDQLSGTVPIGREASQVVLLAPGTMQGDSAFNDPSRGYTPGQSLASMGGASVAENAYQLNGLNITNFRNGLGSTFVPFEFVQELQIKTGGYGAEYGRATGGVVNMVTKSGTNSFHGSASVYFRPESLQEQQPNTYRSYNQDETIEETEANVSIGGPIVKDHLFFFAFLRHWQQDSLRLLTADGTGYEISQPYYGGKADWNITPNHRVEATYINDDVETDVTNYTYDPVAGIGPPGLTGLQIRGGQNYIGKYTGILSTNFMLSAQYGRNDFDRTNTSQGDGCPFTWDFRGGGAVRLGCWVNWSRGSAFDGREAGRIDADWYLGDHSLRAGVDAEANTSEDSEYYTGGIAYWYYDGSEPTDEFPYEVDVRHYENAGSWDTNSRAAYAQDSWAVASNVTLNLGLRYEEFENKNAHGETFIEVTDQWAPRLGVIWDPSGQGRSKLYGSYGLYYLPIPSNTNVRMAGGVFHEVATFQWNGELNPDGSPAGYTDCGMGNLDGCGNQGSVGDFRPPYRIFSDGTVPDPRETLSTNFDPMSQWELILGYERMVGSAWSLGARFVARQFNEVIDDFAIDQALWEVYGVECYNPENRSCWGGYRLGNPGKDFEGWVDLEGNGELTPMRIPAEDLGFPKPRRNYYAVELTFKRRFSNHWMLEGSYTWSHLYGNYEGTVLSDNGQDDAGLTIMFDYPGLMENSYGELAQDRRHNLKVFGAYSWDVGLQMGANAGWRTGRPINSFGVHPTDIYAQSYGHDSFYSFGEPTPRGTLGTTDDLAWLDLMLKYDFRLGVDWFVRLDVFNLFNRSSVTEVNEYAEQDSSSPPNYVADPHYGEPTYFQSPRSVRFGIGLSF